MANIQDGRATAGLAAVENVTKALRYTQVPRTIRTYTMSATTGTIAAALAANSTVLALRMSPAAGNLNAFITRVRLMYTTIVAYTTPVTAGRRLGLYRGAGAAASGGTAVADFTQKDASAPASQCAAGQGGDARIATTLGLTVTGITYETQPIVEAPLVHVGAAGAFADFTFEFDMLPHPIVLSAGQLLAVRNPAAMDAAGTWTLTAIVEWHEALALSSTTADS